MKAWLTFLVFLSIVLNLNAQSLRHQVSNDSILLGNYFIYEIELTNVGGDITPPNLQSFEIVSGPNVSTSMSIINGDMTQSKTMSWSLRPIDLGQYFLEPIFVEDGDEYYEADAIEINVFPNPDGIIENPRQNTMDDFFNMKRPPLMDRMKTPSSESEKKKPKRELKKG